MNGPVTLLNPARCGQGRLYIYLNVYKYIQAGGRYSLIIIDNKRLK